MLAKLSTKSDDSIMSIVKDGRGRISHPEWEVVGIHDDKTARVIYLITPHIHAGTTIHGVFGSIRGIVYFDDSSLLVVDERKLVSIYGLVTSLK